MTIAWILALATVSLDAGAIVQRVSLEPAAQTVAPGETATVTIVYDCLDPELPGLGVRVHYDSSKITFESAEVLFTKDTHGAEDQPDADQYDDRNPETDRRVLFAWSTFNFVWPGPSATLPLALAKLTFRSKGVPARLDLTGVHCADCSLETHGAQIQIVEGLPATPEPGPSPTPGSPYGLPTETPPPTLNGQAPATGIPTTSQLGLLVLAVALGGYALIFLLRDR